MPSYQLLIDLHAVQDRRLAGTGVARYTAELSRALLAAGAPIAGLALDPALGWPDDLHPELAAAPQLCWNTARQLRRLRDEGPVGYHVTAAVDGRRPVHGPLPPHLVGHGVPLVATVHGPVGTAGPEGSDRLRQQTLGRADLVVTPSEQLGQAARAALGLPPGRVVAVGAGVSSFWKPGAEGDDVYTVLRDHVPGITGPFVLTTAGDETVVGVVAGLAPEVQLVVTGPLGPGQADRWRARAASCGMAPSRLVLTGVLLDPVLRAAYQQATAFLAPGAARVGMAALEAAACGCPTVVATTAGAHGHEPLERVISDPALASRLREAGLATAREHSWAGVARRVIDAYGRLDSPTRPLRRRTVRIALVGPMAPTRSGVAAYTTRLASHLADRCALDCVTDVGGHAGAPAPAGGRGFRRFSYGALGGILAPTDYDAVVYALGRDPSCGPAHGLATRYPGVAWFHDLRMADHVLARAAALPPGAGRSLLAAALDRQYGDRAPLHLLDGADGGGADAFERAGALLAGEVLGRSRCAVVSSHMARRLLDLDAGPLAPPVDTWVVPLAVPPATAGAGRPDGAAPLIVALGAVTAAKRPEVVLTAASLANLITPVRLAFVGDVEPVLAAELRGRARTLGLGDRFELTGYVDDECYRGWSSRATCAVQLDARRTGAGSAALNDALAAGLATITNVAAAAELPPGTVERVAADVTLDDLNTHLVRLLVAPGHRAAVAARARAYAGAWTFADVAESMVEIAGRGVTRRHR